MRKRRSVELRGIAGHCPTIDFAFVAGNLVDTLLFVSGGHRALDQRGVDNVGHWKMDTVLNKLSGHFEHH